MNKRSIQPARPAAPARSVASTTRLARVAALGLALASAAIAVPGVHAAPAASSVDPNVKEIDLDNGMRVLLYRRAGDPNVAAGWVAKVGSVNERPGITGLSHLFEHMMFKGTHVVGVKPGTIDADLDLNRRQDEVRARLRREEEALDLRVRRGELTAADAGKPEARTPEHQRLLDEFQALLKQQKENHVDNEFDKIYTGHGGSNMNAFTSHDLTAYFVTVPANKLELWFWMESDRLANPVFRQFYSERDVVWEERRMRVDSTPTGKLDEQYDAMFWAASPYSWPVIGWPSDLNGITREEADAYFERNYSPNNLTAALVGDFDLAQAERYARAYFGRLERAKEEPIGVRTFEPEREGVMRYEAEAETRPTVKMRWHTVQYGHADDPALTVLADLLNGETGRLEKTLVKDRKIATSAGAGQESRKFGGFFNLQGITAPGHTVEELEAALLDELRKLATEPVGARELEKVKNQALATKYRRMEGNFNIMIQLIIYDAMSDWRDMFTEADKYVAVTAEDVQRVAAAYLPANERVVAVYRTKGGEAAAAPTDDALASLPPEMQQQAQMVKAQLAAATKDQLPLIEAQLAQMQAGKDQAPEEMRGFLTWVIEAMTARIAELQGESK